MKKIIVGLMAAIFTTSVFAACPMWAPYGCKLGPNGKMICGCGM